MTTAADTRRVVRDERPKTEAAVVRYLNDIVTTTKETKK